MQSRDLPNAIETSIVLFQHSAGPGSNSGFWTITPRLYFLNGGRKSVEERAEDVSILLARSLGCIEK